MNTSQYTNYPSKKYNWHVSKWRMILPAHIYGLENIPFETSTFFSQKMMLHTFTSNTHCSLHNRVKLFNPHNLLKSSEYQNIRVYFPTFSWHSTQFVTWAGEKVCLRIRCYQSMELCIIIHPSTTPTVNFGLPGCGGTAWKQCSKWEAMAGLLQSFIPAAVECIYFFLIAALVRTAWDWSPLYIDTDFVKRWMLWNLRVKTHVNEPKN